MYLSSTDNREYILDGILIPKNHYTADQEAAGKRRYVSITLSQYQSLCSNAVFKSMLASGVFNVTEDLPAGASPTAAELADQLKAANARITELETKTVTQEAVSEPEEETTESVTAEEFEDYANEEEDE